MTDGSGQPLRWRHSCLSSPVVLLTQAVPMAGSREESVLGFMIRHCSPLALVGPMEQVSRSKLRPGGWRRDEGTPDNSSQTQRDSRGFWGSVPCSHYWLTLGGITELQNVRNLETQIKVCRNSITTISPAAPLLEGKPQSCSWKIKKRHEVRPCFVASPCSPTPLVWQCGLLSGSAYNEHSSTQKQRAHSKRRPYLLP